MECDAISLVQGLLESNTFTRYLVQVVWPWSRTCPNLFTDPWAAVFHNVQLVKLNVLCCIWFKMDDSFSTMSSSNSQKLPSFWGTIMKLPSELSGEDTMNIGTLCSRVEKSRDSARNLDLNDLPQSWRPVVATHSFNRQKFDELIQEHNWITSAAIACIRIEILPHPVYCLDLAPSDFLVVCCSQETHIKGISFICDDAQAATRKMFGK